MCRNIACCVSVCQDRLTESQGFAVKLRIYAAESGKSLSPCRHISLFLHFFSDPFTLFFCALFGIEVSRWREMSPPLPSRDLPGLTW